jgi:hypothetical protein
MSRKTSIVIKLTSEERVELSRRSRLLMAPHRMVARAKLVLMLADGMSFTSTAKAVGKPFKWTKKSFEKVLSNITWSPNYSVRHRIL